MQGNGNWRFLFGSLVLGLVCLFLFFLALCEGERLFRAHVNFRNEQKESRLCTNFFQRLVGEIVNV